MAKHDRRKTSGQPQSSRPVTIQVPLPVLGVVNGVREAFHGLCIAPAHVQREDPYRRISPPPANNPKSSGLFQRVQDLVLRDGDRVGVAPASLDLDEPEFAGGRIPALDVVTELVELAVGRLEAETALGLHHDGARPRDGELGVVRPPGTRHRPAGHLVD